MAPTHLVCVMGMQLSLSKRCDLKQKGLGNQADVAEALGDTREERLWESKQLGAETPQSLWRRFCGIIHTQKEMRHFVFTSG